MGVQLCEGFEDKFVEFVESLPAVLELVPPFPSCPPTVSCG